MSTPVVPISLITFKMIREHEETKRTQYQSAELYAFAHRALQIAGQIDNEDYWILSSNKYGTDFHEEMSKICDINNGFYQLNIDKLNNGGKEYAKRIIGVMPYSFLKGALQVLNEELQASEEKGLLCD